VKWISEEVGGGQGEGEGRVLVCVATASSSALAVNPFADCFVENRCYKDMDFFTPMEAREGFAVCLLQNDCIAMDANGAIDIGKIVNCIQKIPIINPRPVCEAYVDTIPLLACLNEQVPLDLLKCALPHIRLSPGANTIVNCLTDVCSDTLPDETSMPAELQACLGACAEGDLECGVQCVLSQLPEEIKPIIDGVQSCAQLCTTDDGIDIACLSECTLTVFPDDVSTCLSAAIEVKDSAALIECVLNRNTTRLSLD
jgi:hypothetical protein